MRRKNRSRGNKIIVYHPQQRRLLRLKGTFTPSGTAEMCAAGAWWPRIKETSIDRKFAELGSARPTRPTWLPAAHQQRGVQSTWIPSWRRPPPSSTPWAVPTARTVLFGGASLVVGGEMAVCTVSNHSRSSPLQKRRLIACCPTYRRLTRYMYLCSWACCRSCSLSSLCYRCW